MTIDPAADHVRLKDMGNDAYKKGEYDLALDAYTRALDTSKEDKIRDEELAILYKNRALVLLKNEDFQSAVADCTKCLELVRYLYTLVKWQNMYVSYRVVHHVSDLV